MTTDRTQADYGHYDADHCGGVMAKSGKGGGPRHGPKTTARHQKVMAFPAWGGKSGTDVYFSSRWDNACQIYDHFHSNKSIESWWRTHPADWVFVQEIPFSVRQDDFVWYNAKSLPTPSELKKKRWGQRQQFLRDAALRRRSGR